MSNDITLQSKNDLMTRVKTVQGIRLVKNSPLVGSLFTSLLVLATTSLVSFGDVLSNTMMNVDWNTRLSYAFSALLHSRFIVQIFAVLIVFSCIMVGINLWKTSNFGSRQKSMVGAGIQ